MPIPVFYNPLMNADDGDSISPSPRKPRLVVENWLFEKMPIMIAGFDPASQSDLCTAHSPEYVNGVMSLDLPNGMGTKSKSVRDSLPYTTGSFVAAARHVAELHKTGRVNAACSPSSGFHHAHYGHGGWFCTFNGLMVAVRELLDSGLAKTISIVDCDYHYGDGTDDIIYQLGLSDHVLHFTSGAQYRTTDAARRMLSALAAALHIHKDRGAEIVFYQAGADQHIDDPLGGILTTEEMIERDQIVFETCRDLGMSVVWNLAGGYQSPIQKIVDLHTNTMKECIHAFN